MKFRNLVFLWIIAGLIGHSFLMAGPLPAKAQTNSSTSNLEGVDEVLDVDWTEPDFDVGEIQKNQPLQEFAQKLDAIENRTKELQDLFSLVDRARLIVSEEDIDAIREGKVDERVLKTLIYLVTPIDQGGAGFERIKVKRLVRGYTTEKRAFSKETPYENEGEANISAHFDGQAVDISEIDSIKMKKKTKKKFIGFTYSSKTEDLPSVPIQVAWQTEEGKGEGIPGFYGETANELYDNLSTGTFKEMLSDLIDYNLDKLKGKNLPEWAKWLGVIILSEDFGLPTDGFEDGKDFQGMLKEMGRAVLAEHLKIDKEAIQGNSRGELILNIGRNYLEKKMKLPAGSLKGDSLEEILKNTGKRKMEKELGLPQGALDGNLKEKLKIIKENRKWNTYKTDQAKNEAFDLPEGSAEQINAEDENGLVLVGAGVLFYALGVGSANKKDLLLKIKNKEPLPAEIKVGEEEITVDVETDNLKALVSKNKDERNNMLKTLGESALSALSLNPDLSLGLTQAEWTKVVNGQTKVDDLALLIGARKYENEFNLPKNAIYYNLQQYLHTNKINTDDFLINVGRASIEEQGQNPDKFSIAEKKEAGRNTLRETIVTELNKHYKLTEKYQITEDDILDLFNGKWENVAQKIAGTKIDKALGFPENGTMDLIKGGKTAEDILKASGAIKLGKLMGLSRPVSVEGNLKQNYGQALVEEKLGLKPGSFTENIQNVESSNPEAIGLVRENPDKFDGIFALPGGTTRALLEGKVSVPDYSKKVAEKAVLSIGLDRLVDMLDLKDEYKPTQDDLNLIISVVQDWDNASWDNKKAAFSVLAKIAGKTLDSKSDFEVETFSQIIAQPDAAPEILLTQGMRKLNKKIFGIDKDVIVLHYKEGKGLDVKIDNQALSEWAIPKIKQVTNIPDDEDVKSFLNGNIKDGFTFWGIASLVKEANEIFTKHDMPIVAAEITYENAKRAYFGDPAYEEQQAEEMWKKSSYYRPEEETSEEYRIGIAEFKNQFKEDARREIRSEARKNFQYKMMDAFLIDKVDESIPVGFSKTMYEGTPEERSAMIGSYVLNKITKGEIIIPPQDLRLIAEGKYDELSIDAFASIDSYLSKHEILGFTLQSDPSKNLYTSKALFKVVQGGNKLKEGLNELETLYINQWATQRVFAFADKKLGLPAGGTYQIYEQYQAYRQASDAYKAAKNALAAAKIANDSAKIANAQKAVDDAGTKLNKIKKTGIDFVAQLAFKKSFAKLDQKLGLPSGTTSALASYLITGSTVGLILVVASTLFKVSVEYYGETPVCEQVEAESTTKSLKDIINKLFNKSGIAGYERLSGDPQADFPFYQRHAQCSVKRLIGALLLMPEKTGDKTLRPTQILTYRPEDVDFYADKVYELYGKTQAERGWRGLFSNDLLWQWVHIGY